MWRSLLNPADFLDSSFNFNLKHYLNDLLESWKIAFVSNFKIKINSDFSMFVFLNQHTNYKFINFDSAFEKYIATVFKFMMIIDRYY